LKDSTRGHDTGKRAGKRALSAARQEITMAAMKIAKHATKLLALLCPVNVARLA
jgi:hypothetical protein